MQSSNFNVNTPKPHIVDIGKLLSKMKNSISL